MFQYEFFSAIDILGTFSFSVSGAFFAMEKKLDPFGVIIIAFATAIGGGTLRDVLIGNLPVGWLTNGTATITIFIAAVGSMFFEARLRQLTSTLFLFDALGLGLFTIVGVQKGIEQHFSIGVCIAIGTITASFGGVIRDVLLNHVPLVFRKEIYALASIIGGLFYFLLRHLELDNNLTKTICILLIFAIRLVAVKFHLGLPAFYLTKDKKL
jgi:uncharacterized membrane protein YeiH